MLALGFGPRHAKSEAYFRRRIRSSLTLSLCGLQPRKFFTVHVGLS